VRLLPVILLLALTASHARAIDPLPAHAADPVPGSQVLVEIGWAKPLGDLGDDFNRTALGFGARDGFELGFRWRKHLTRRLSVAPAFHFSDYGNHSDFLITYDNEGLVDEVEEVDISCTVYRYTVEVLYTLKDPDATVVPFVGAGGGLYRNRVRGYYKIFDIPLDESVNTLGLQARLGLRFDQLELSAVYHLNRFSTWRFFRTGTDQPYSWDTFSMRLGWVIPF
jgi:hypothetical protein